MTSTVPPGRSSLHRYPGTSCLATINLSLRDKSLSPTQGSRIKLALMGFNPGKLKNQRLALKGLEAKDKSRTLLAHSICRPFRARRSGWTVPRVETLG
jgi:hypothetical protein